MATKSTEVQAAEDKVLVPFDISGNERLTAFFRDDQSVQGLIDAITVVVTEAKTSDVSTPTARKAIKSLAANINKTVAYVDDKGKDLVAELKKLPAEIDAGRKKLRDQLGGLRLEVLEPIRKWEEEQETIRQEKEAKETAAREAKELAERIERDHELALVMNIAWEAERKAAKAAEELRAEQLREEGRRQAQQEAANNAANAASQAAASVATAITEAKPQQEPVAALPEPTPEPEKTPEPEQKPENEVREYRRDCNRAAIADLMSEASLTEDQAKAVIRAVAMGDIRHIVMSY